MQRERGEARGCRPVRVEAAARRERARCEVQGRAGARHPVVVDLEPGGRPPPRPRLGAGLHEQAQRLHLVPLPDLQALPLALPEAALDRALQRERRLEPAEPGVREERLRARVGQLPHLRVEPVAEVAPLRHLVVTGNVRLVHVLVGEREQGARGGPEESLCVHRPLVVGRGRLRAEVAPGHEVSERARVGPGVECPALPRHLALRPDGAVHAVAHAPQEDPGRGLRLLSRQAWTADEDVHHAADRVAAVERRARAAHHLEPLDRVRGDGGEVLVGPVPEGRVAEADAVHHQQHLVAGQAPDEGRPAAVVRLLHEDPGHPGERLGRRAEGLSGELVALARRHGLGQVERPPLVSLRRHGDRLVDADEQGLEHEVDRLAAGRRPDLDAPVPREARPETVPSRGHVGQRERAVAPARRLVRCLRELEDDPRRGPPERASRTVPCTSSARERPASSRATPTTRNARRSMSSAMTRAILPAGPRSAAGRERPTCRGTG